MKRSTQFLPLLLLAFSLTAPISAQKGDAPKADSLTVVFTQYTQSLKAQQEAESAHEEAQNALQKALEAFKKDITNADNKKLVAAAEVKADSIQEVLKAKKEETQKAEQQLLTLFHSAPTAVPLWLAALLGVLLVGVSLIGGMRMANTLAKKRKARKDKADVDYARCTTLVTEKKTNDPNLWVSLNAFIAFNADKLALETASQKNVRNRKRSSGKPASPRTYLLQTVRVPSQEDDINQFGQQLLAYYGQMMEPKAYHKLLKNCFTEEGMGRRVYHLPLWASTEENDELPQSVVKEGTRYYFKPFPTFVAEQPDVESPFAALDEVLQQLQPSADAPVGETPAADAPVAEASAPQSDNEQTQPAETAENANVSSNTVEWVIDRDATEALPEQTAEPAAVSEDAPIIQQPAQQPVQQPTAAGQGILVSTATLEAIAQARQVEKSALQALLLQGQEASRSLSSQGDLARQLADEQNTTRQLRADLEQLRSGNAELAKAVKDGEQKLQRAAAEQKKLSEAKDQLQTAKQRLQGEVQNLQTEVKNCKTAQESYRKAIDFWPELQPMAQQLLQFFDSSRQIELHAEGMAAYAEGADDDRNYYLVRIARKMHEQLAAAADIVEPLRADLPLLVKHQMVRTDGWIYTQLRTVKAAERAGTLHQLIERALVQVLNATVIAADEYAYWLPEMLGVSDRVTREFTPLRDQLLADARQLGLKVAHVQPFTAINPTNTENLDFWPDDQHRWQPGTVIEVFRLAVNSSKAQVKATKP